MSVLLGTAQASGADFVRGPLVQVSGPSPFAGCTADQIGGQGGPAFLDTEFEPYLAVNPANPQDLVALWAQDLMTDPDGRPIPGGKGEVAGVSFNGGATWRTVVLPGNSPCSGSTTFSRTGGDSWVTFAPNGDLYASTLGLGVYPDFVPEAVLVSKSTDGGLTWGAPAALNLITKGHFFNDKEMIAADPLDPDFVYAVWTLRPTATFTTEGFQTMFSRTTDGGQTWEPARVIYEMKTNDEPFANVLVALPDGSLLNFFTEVLWAGDEGGRVHYTHRLSLLRSTDRGQSWSPAPKKEATHVADMQVACPPGSEFLASPCVTDPDGGSDRLRTLSVVFDAKVDPSNGNLYVAWEDRRFSGGQYVEIAFSKSTDGGFTWSEPIRVSQTPSSATLGNRQAFRPAVAVTQDGAVGVTYYDFRFNDAGPGAMTDYWLVHCDSTTPTACTDPADWSSETRLTDASFDFLQVPSLVGHFLGDYMGLQSSGGDFLALFGLAQGTDGASVFFRRVRASGPAAQSSESPGYLATSPQSLVGGTEQAKKADCSARVCSELTGLDTCCVCGYNSVVCSQGQHCCNCGGFGTCLPKGRVCPGGGGC